MMEICQYTCRHPYAVCKLLAVFESSNIDNHFDVTGLRRTSFSNDQVAVSCSRDPVDLSEAVTVAVITYADEVAGPTASFTFAYLCRITTLQDCLPGDRKTLWAKP